MCFLILKYKSAKNSIWLPFVTKHGYFVGAPPSAEVEHPTQFFPIRPFLASFIFTDVGRRLHGNAKVISAGWQFFGHMLRMIILNTKLHAGMVIAVASSDHLNAESEPNIILRGASSLGLALGTN